MSEETSQLLSLVNRGEYEEALLLFQKVQEQDPASLRKLAIDAIFDAATKFRDNNDDHLRAVVSSLFDAIHPEQLKFRICFNFITGRTTSHLNELLTNQLGALLSRNFKERHPHEWDEICNVLPMKLEENLAKEDDPNILDSALEAADILYHLRDVPYVLPQRMMAAFAAAVHSGEMELPRAFPLLFFYSKTHPFSPKLLNITEPATLVPCVYSRSSLGRYLIIGLTKYLHGNEYNYERFFVIPVDLALKRIINTLDNLDTADIDLCARLILPLLRFIEDFQQHSFRASIMKKCRELILLFPPRPRVLLIKNVLIKIFDNSDLHLENEAVVVAWFVDQYRLDLDDEAFRAEVGSFLGMLEDTRYDNMSMATNYYSSIFVLIQALAIKRFNLNMLAEVETRIIRRIYDQLTDYIRLEEMRAKDEKSKETKAPALPEGIDFDVGPSFEGSIVDQMQLLLFECEQARNYIAEALRSST